jgi:S-formylglutathione hydrolase FrmB
MHAERPYPAMGCMTSSWRHEIAHISLVDGWLPVLMQVAAAVVLILAIGWRTRRWRRIWLPVAILGGIGLGAWAHWYVGSAGLAGEPAPASLWLWIALTGLSAVAVVGGWRGVGWRRRALSVLAVPSSLVCAALVLNLWVGYLPTVGTAWNELTAGPLPNQTDRATVSAMQLAGTVPTKGVIVPVEISSRASNFAHRRELVYLPPAWFAANPPPRLPAVMMIGAEFNSPTDWLRAGDAIAAIDGLAAAHDGFAPVFVFVDSGGGFNVDTECVNGSRGNAADHLTKDVVPFLISDFGVSARSANWGVVGFSAGGTCAIDLAAMHPELFGGFVDIAGDMGPNTGTKDQTVSRLFAGDVTAWNTFDPTTVMTGHPAYQGLSGLFVSSDAPAGGHDDAPAAENPQHATANSLCALGRSRGIACAVVAEPGRHDWPFAGRAFASALPWLAGQLQTPGVPSIPLPAPTDSPATSSLAGPSLQRPR